MNTTNILVDEIYYSRLHTYAVLLASQMKSHLFNYVFGHANASNSSKAKTHSPHKKSSLCKQQD